MNKTKFSILLLLSAAILLFASCGAMMVEDTDDMSIDLSSVVSRAATDQYAKIRLVASGTNNFFPLAANQAFQQVIDGKVSLTNIPVGPVYTIYLSIGTNENNIFRVAKAINGNVSVTGGTTTQATLKVQTIKTEPIPFYTGKSLKGAAFANGMINTVSADGTKLYYGTAGLSKTAAAGFLFNNVKEGYGKAVISTRNADGKGFVTFNGSTVNYAYTETDDPGTADVDESLAGNIVGDDKSLDIIAADVFWDTTEELEIVVGQTEGGLVFSIEDFTVSEEMHDWFVLDLEPYLEDAGIPLAGKLIKGITVVKKYNALNEVDALWIFMASIAGDFRIKMALNADGFDIAGEDAIFDLFEPFTAGNALEERKILNISNPTGDTLYIGTDQGLYKATATEAITSMAPVVVAAAGKRVERLSSNTHYTACVTALNLIVVRNSDNKVARIAFNEGLPVSELLSGGAVTGLDWGDNDVLYVAGNYGLVKLNAAGLTYN